jgi:hypothetical protein
MLAAAICIGMLTLRQSSEWAVTDMLLQAIFLSFIVLSSLLASLLVALPVFIFDRFLVAGFRNVIFFVVVVNVAALSGKVAYLNCYVDNSEMNSNIVIFAMAVLIGRFSTVALQRCLDKSHTQAASTGLNRSE